MKDKAWVTERIDAMAKRPLMYAVTKEGFLMQLWVLLEIIGADDDALRFRLGVRCLTNDGRKGVEQMDEAFAVKATTAAREILAKLP